MLKLRILEIGTVSKLLFCTKSKIFSCRCRWGDEDDDDDEQEEEEDEDVFFVEEEEEEEWKPLQSLNTLFEDTSFLPLWTTNIYS